RLRLAAPRGGVFCLGAARRQKKTTDMIGGFFYIKAQELHALDFFQHLENTLGGVDEQALERLAQATAFQGVTTHTFALSHDDLR
ncbi:hypothetical protein, partial [Bordetella muralis]|uniref:hypothetical protein n=1 Tax=Bordetella muralis TaxID=1649130 RepID=UPI0039F06A1A